MIDRICFGIKDENELAYGRLEKNNENLKLVKHKYVPRCD